MGHRLSMPGRSASRKASEAHNNHNQVNRFSGVRHRRRINRGKGVSDGSVLAHVESSEKSLGLDFPHRRRNAFKNTQAQCYDSDTFTHDFCV